MNPEFDLNARFEEALLGPKTSYLDEAMKEVGPDGFRKAIADALEVLKDRGLVATEPSHLIEARERLREQVVRELKKRAVEEEAEQAVERGRPVLHSRSRKSGLAE